MKKHLLLFSLFFFAVCSLSAQTFNPDYPNEPFMNPVTTAAPFLLIAPDSRAGGMGDMGVATAPDNYSQHHNPAKYVFNEDVFGIGIAYSPWLKGLVNDIHLAYLSTFWKITEDDAVAFSLRYFSLGELQFTDLQGNPRGSPIIPNEFALDFTYSRKLSPIVSMAITPRFIYSNLTAGFHDQSSGIDMKAALAGAVDISLFVNKEFTHGGYGLKSSEIMFGVNISNIGNKVSYSSESNARRDFLPCNLRLGLSYAMAFDEYNKLAVGVEAGKLLVPTPSVRDTTTSEIIWHGNGGRDAMEFNPIVGIGRSFFGAPGGVGEKFREVVWSVGLEYSYRDLLFVRTGTFLENKYKGNRKFATVGVGVKYNIFAIDVCYLFSFQQKHPLENTLRFSLTFLLESFNRDQIRNQGRLN
jgi:hypothetical protein